MPKLIMMTGLQGTGKSTIANRLATELQYPLLSKDRFEAIFYNNQLTDGYSIYSYYAILETAHLQLSLNVSCILDAVFPMAGFRNRVREIATETDAHLYIIHTHCSDESLHKHRIETRESWVPWNRPIWEDTMHTKSYYESWMPNEALFLDSINPLETNIQKALQYIGKRP